MRFAYFWVQLLRGQKRLCILRVVSQDITAEFYLAARFVNQLAHFQSRQFGEIIHVCLQQRGGLIDDHCARGKASVLPGLKAGIGSGQGFFKLGVGQLFKAF